MPLNILIERALSIDDLAEGWLEPTPMAGPILDDDSDDMRWRELSFRDASPSREDTEDVAPDNFSRVKDLLRLGLGNFDNVSICP